MGVKKIYTNAGQKKKGKKSGEKTKAKQYYFLTCKRNKGKKTKHSIIRNTTRQTNKNKTKNRRTAENVKTKRKKERRARNL